MDPDVEFSDARAGVGVTASGHGLAQLQAANAEVEEAFDAWTVEVKALEELGRTASSPSSGSMSRVAPAE